MIDLNFNVLDAAQRRSRWNQARQGRPTDERGVRDDEEIVGGLGLDFARAGRTREGGDFSIRLAGRKRKRIRRSLRGQQQQSQRAHADFVDGEGRQHKGPQPAKGRRFIYRFVLFIHHNMFHGLLFCASDWSEELPSLAPSAHLREREPNAPNESESRGRRLERQRGK